MDSPAADYLYLSCYIMKSLLFLDIDGVLNNHRFNDLSNSTTIDPDKMELLNTVIIAADCKVVVSSAWRYLVHRTDMTLRGLQYLLQTHGMAVDRLHGITRRDTMVDGKPLHNERGQQIKDYLDSAKPRPAKYAVVDDLDLGISQMHPFVQTISSVGLTEAETMKLIRLLK